MLDAPDARELARFYSRLLGWMIGTEESDWVTMKPDDGVAYLGFPTSPERLCPSDPPADGRQQQMLHLDLEVGDLDAAVVRAVEAGATLAEFQPQRARPRDARPGRAPVLPLRRRPGRRRRSRHLIRRSGHRAGRIGAEFHDLVAIVHMHDAGGVRGDLPLVDELERHDDHQIAG